VNAFDCREFEHPESSHSRSPHSCRSVSEPDFRKPQNPVYLWSI
jgi:hypothetical protein